ncbi:DNA polymerase Y family protein [Shewanella alkalitolerans]|uniref:Y-family DNA polymerase n=1 Tax=Shewanella alkalitolerans TaxID=2864209 RepID=UPI001C65D31B|nr:DNA polymerase Y family protein [Shewanella alkalitolerans]QYJ96052.1 DNA polymerase Y family protein [Shewanella alkalitolerans]
MLWLAVYFPHWLLQYQSYHQGLPQGGELALFERQSSQILIASSAAAKLGVEPGQSLATAQALCPSLQLLAYEPSLSQEASHWLCQWSYGYSARVVPPVCPFEQAQQHRLNKPSKSHKASKSSRSYDVPSVADTLLLEVGSMAKIFGGLDRLIRQYQKSAQGYGLECQFALGENALLAQLGARHLPLTLPADVTCDNKRNPKETRESRCTKLGNSKRGNFKPESLESEIGATASTYLANREVREAALEEKNQEEKNQEEKALGEKGQGEETKAQSIDEQAGASLVSLPLIALKQVAPLPLSVLPLPGHVLQSCENMGLTQVQALLALPLKELGERFGESVLTLLAQLKGLLPQVHEFYQMPESYRHKLELLYEVSHLEGLAFPLGRMLGTLSAYLVQRQQAVLALSLTLVFRDLSLVPLRCEIRYPFAEHRADALLKLCRVQLESLTLAAPVISLAIQADTLVPLSVQTSNWWQGEGKSDASMRLLSLLEARLGADKVKGLEHCSHHLPELSWQSRSLSQSRASQSRSGALGGKRSNQAVSQSASRQNTSCQSISSQSVSTRGASSQKFESQALERQAYDRCAEPRASYQGKTRALSEEATLFADLFHGLCDGRIRPNWLLRQPEPLAPESVSLLKGPERLHSPWSAASPRDYYLARMHQGGLCWVFRSPEGLFLQGWFG